ncbi:MAG: phage/plasmid primase, P4 family [Oscillospiraceae bacterium]|nr:phage/plasmid primase, P4 family [Oscillospiraceae bacterium]
MTFKLYTADVNGVASNCLYPNEVTVSTAEEIAEAVKNDYVAARYRDSYRSNINFIESELEIFDCDNDWTDNPDKWITPDYMADEFASVSFVLIPSRNNLKSKNGKAPRPKFHVAFPIDKCTDAEKYAGIKNAVRVKYDFFDKNALDAARFFYGSQINAEDIVIHEGFETIEEFMGLDRTNFPSADNVKNSSNCTYAPYSKIIHTGERNSTLSRFAARVLKKYGNTDKTRELFLQRAEDCEEPLDDAELNTIWNSAVGFYTKTVLSDPDYKAPDEYNNDFGNFSLKPDDYSDAGQAVVFAREYSDIVKYTDGTHYIHYSGEHWEESALSGLLPYMEFIDLQLADARETLAIAKENLINTGVPKEAVSAGGRTLAKACDNDLKFEAFELYKSAMQYYLFVLKHRDFKYIQSTVNTARTILRINVKDLDKDGFLINTPGLTIDLRKDISEGYTPKPSDLLTKQTTQCPGDKGEQIWLDALDTFFCNDAELIAYVQKIVGLAVIGEVFIEALIIAYGDGRNGKSTFWNTIANVLGSYSGSISAETLTVGCRHNARPEMAELKGKRLVIAAELEDGVRLSTAMVKKLCSTDEIAAEKKYKDPFKYKPSHTLVLYTNHLPRVGVSDEGTWRRLIVIPFNAKIEGNSDIKNYTNYLTENAGPAIMKWIIEGAKKAIKDDFHLKKPQIVIDAIKKYREENDWLGRFLDERCELDSSYKQKSGEFYQAYRDFCNSTGEFVRSTADFYTALDGVGLERKKNNKGSFISGVRLKVDEFLE